MKLRRFETALIVASFVLEMFSLVALAARDCEGAHEFLRQAQRIVR